MQDTAIFVLYVARLGKANANVSIEVATDQNQVIIRNDLCDIHLIAPEFGSHIKSSIVDKSLAEITGFGFIVIIGSL